jgi:hypothetical protein
MEKEADIFLKNRIYHDSSYHWILPCPFQFIIHSHPAIAEPNLLTNDETSAD